MNRFKLTTDEKLRGGYYTPLMIAEALCKWAVRSIGDTILEPSCGDGVFVEAASKRLISLGQEHRTAASQITGIEIAEEEAQRARNRLANTTKSGNGDFIFAGDYFLWYKNNCERLFDCVVGNPPFIRYQNFPEPSRTHAMDALEFLGMKANRLTNVWVPFVAAATSQLKTGGRLAMIIPAELLQVSYASQLREFLISQFDSIDILACNEMLFDGAEQEVVLVLADGKTQKSKGDHSCRINLVEVRNIDDLLSHAQSGRTGNGDSKIVHHDREKWLKYFLSSQEIGLMRELRNAPEVGVVGDVATVDVGVVTGKNEFFILSDDQLRTRGLEKHAISIVARSSHLKGAILRKQDYTTMAKNGERVFLLYLPAEIAGRLPKSVRAYIEEGERLGFHKNYKCSIREPWYSVPTIWVPPCFMFRQIYDFPRIVKNAAKATSTDTIHRMRCKSPIDRFIQNAYTSLTAASAEIEGRSYGGGVLELEPTEAEKLLFPKSLSDGLSLAEIDELIRAGRLSAVIEQNDIMILRRGIGLSDRDCATLRGIWEKMRIRRQSRGRKSRNGKAHSKTRLSAGATVAAQS